MREERQGLEWIPNCQRNLRLKWGCTKDLCCHVYLFALVVIVVAEFAREGVLSELCALYADNLVLMSETIEGLTDKLVKWKMAFESKGLKVNLGKAW